MSKLMDTRSVRLTEQGWSKVIAAVGAPSPELKDYVVEQLFDQRWEPLRVPLMKGREHLTEEGEFRSDKYPWCRDGFVPLKISDKMTWGILRLYTNARASLDSEFSRDVNEALDNAGAAPLHGPMELVEKPVRKKIENARAMADNLHKTPGSEQHLTHIQTFIEQAIRDLCDCVEAMWEELEKTVREDDEDRARPEAT